MAERVVAASIQFNGITQAANSIAALNKELQKLKDEQKKADPTSARYKELEQNIASVTSELKGLQDQQKAVNREFEEAKLAAGSYAALQAETKRLTAEFKNMAVGINATQEQYDATLAKIKANNEEITRLNREMRNSKSIAERFREGAVAAFKDVALSIAAGVTALEGFNALKGLGDLSLELDRGFAQVNTVAQLTEEQLASLKDQVLETSKDSVVNLEEVPGALFKILSATGDVDESQKILAASLKAAKVGFSDLGSAADAGSGIFSAVKDQVKDVNEVFDVLFRTQKEGVLTFADLAKGIPQVTPAANALGVSFKETASALATLTKAGVSADIGITQLKAGLTELNQKDKQAGLKSIGVNIFDASGKVNTLNNIIGQLGKSLDGLTDEERSAKLQKVGFGSEAVGSILTLTRNIETFGQVTSSIVDGSLGEFERQLAASANTSDDLKAATNNLKVTLIQELQPAFNGVAQGLVGIADAAAKVIGFFLQNKGAILLLVSAYALLNAAKIQAIANTIRERTVQAAKLLIDRAEAALLAVRAGATTAYSIASQLLTGRLTLAAAAQRLLNLAMASNPVGLVVAGVTALAGALLLFSNRSKEAAAAEKARAAAMRAVDDAVKSTNEEIGKEIASLEILVRGVRDETKSKQEKKAITDQLLSQYGKYLGELDKEAVKAGDVEAAYKKIKAAIIDNIVARQKSEAIEKLFGEQIAIQRNAAFQLGKAFELSAEEMLRVIETFKKLPVAIQEATAAGKVQLIDTKNLSDAEKQAIDVFGKIASVRDRTVITGGDFFGVEKANPFIERLKTIEKSTRLIDDGLASIDQKFNRIGGEFDAEGGGFGGDALNATADTVAKLEAKLSELQKTQKETATTAPDWQQQQVEIDKVRAAIERITGASKAHQAESKKEQAAAKKTAEEERESAERRNAALIALRQQLSDALIENQDDETQKLLDAEAERYEKSFQLAMDNIDKVVLAEGATTAEIADAQRTGDALLEQIQLEHYQRLNDIAAKGLKAEIEAQEKADAEALANSRRILGLKLDTVETELDNEEKNFARRRKLIQLESELKIRALELDTLAALREAKNDEERTAIMENEAQKRIKILKDTAAKIKDEKEKEGPLLARILGISPEELAKFQEVFSGFTKVLNDALDTFFEARIEALDKLIERSQERIDRAAELAEKQVNRVKELEERLVNATGTRRESLIRLIEQEKKREAELFAEKVKQEKALAALEARKAEIEKQQAKVRRAQAIAQAVANTAVGITKTIAEVPKVDFGVSTAILIALYAALGAAQVALISAQKFAKGGKVEGPSHAQGGIRGVVRSTGRPIEFEGGEFFTRKEAVANNERILRRINDEGHNTRFSLVGDNDHFAQGGMVAKPNFQAIAAATSAGESQLGTKLDRMIELQAEFLDKPTYVDVVQFTREQERTKRIAFKGST